MRVPAVRFNPTVRIEQPPIPEVIREDKKLIVLFGADGSGKDDFIRRVTGQDDIARVEGHFFSK